MLFQSSKNPVELKVTHLNDAQKERREDLLAAIHDKATFKKLQKTVAKQARKAIKDKRGKKKASDDKERIFVLDFDGDIKASGVAHLREEISTLISTANKGDEVVLRLESPGGLVHGYGLAAAQLARLKEAGLTLTICVDKVAASGGYMMACVADKIYAAPFAVVGSIGVVSQLPNFHKWLKNHDVDYEMFTAGNYKRTVTVFGENTEEDRKKYKEEIEQTHSLFKHFVNTYRSKLDLEKVATGETWYGEDALHLNLIDELKTSDAYLLERMETCDAYAIHSRQKPTLAEKLGFAGGVETATRLVSRTVMQTAMDVASDKLPEMMAKVEQRTRFK